MNGSNRLRERGAAVHTARNVPGKKHIVSTAIAFIAELSFLLSLAMVVVVAASCRFTFESFWAMN
jgi:hypothetical protein